MFKCTKSDKIGQELGRLTQLAQIIKFVKDQNIFIVLIVLNIHFNYRKAYVTGTQDSC